MKTSAGKIPDKITADEIKQAFRDNLHSGIGRPERFATKNDFYLALVLTVRDRIFERTVETIETYVGMNARRVTYLSAEYLPGRHLANNLLNLGIADGIRVINESRPATAEQIASRLRCNAEFGQKVVDEMKPGTTVVVTDQPVVRKPVADSTYFAAK
jgi:glucan phosphorylase